MAANVTHLRAHWRWFVVVATLLVATTGALAMPTERRCRQVCARAAKRCVDAGPQPRACKPRLVRMVNRCAEAGRPCGALLGSGSTTTTTTIVPGTTLRPTSTTLGIPSTSTTLGQQSTTTTSLVETTTSSSTVPATTSTTTTTLPNISGWYGGDLAAGTRCLDDPGHTGDMGPDFISVQVYVDGFAPDATGHYALDIHDGWTCEGGWDTGAPDALTEPDDDPDCLGCAHRYYGEWPPAECGGASWAVLGGSAEALYVKVYDGVPWECHNDWLGTLQPIPAP